MRAVEHLHPVASTDRVRKLVEGHGRAGVTLGVQLLELDGAHAARLVQHAEGVRVHAHDDTHRGATATWNKISYLCQCSALAGAVGSTTTRRSVLEVDKVQELKVAEGGQAARDLVRHNDVAREDLDLPRATATPTNGVNAQPCKHRVPRVGSHLFEAHVAADGGNDVFHHEHRAGLALVAAGEDLDVVARTDVLAQLRQLELDLFLKPCTDSGPAASA